jgi:hypothetical protein
MRHPGGDKIVGLADEALEGAVHDGQAFCGSPGY